MSLWGGFTIPGTNEPFAGVVSGFCILDAFPRVGNLEVSSTFNAKCDAKLLKVITLGRHSIKTDQQQ